MQDTSYNITVFLLVTIFLIMLMGVFIITILFIHRKKQIAYLEKIKDIEANYEKNILQTQLEIQDDAPGSRPVAGEAHRARGADDAGRERQDQVVPRDVRLHPVG